MSEAPQILLEHRLKTLELPTFLREYDKVARQCAHEGLDPVAFLARLVEPELIDRERRLIERRIKAAKFPTIIFDNGRPLLAIGAPGGTQIAMGVLQSTLNFVDFGITPQEAVLAPRFLCYQRHHIGDRAYTALQLSGAGVRRLPVHPQPIQLSNRLGARDRL